MHLSTSSPTQGHAGTTPQTVLSGSVGWCMGWGVGRAFGEAEAGLLTWGLLASITRLPLLRANCYFCSHLSPRHLLYGSSGKMSCCLVLQIFLCLIVWQKQGVMWFGRGIRLLLQFLWPPGEGKLTWFEEEAKKRKTQR